MRTSRISSRLFALGLCGALALGVSACGGDDDDDSSGSDTTEASGDDTSSEADITIEQFAFDAQPVAAGATVTVQNNDDGVEHTVTSDDDGAWDELVITGPDSGEITAPAEAGEYPFHCERHTSMTGTLVVE